MLKTAHTQKEVAMAMLEKLKWWWENYRCPIGIVALIVFLICAMAVAIYRSETYFNTWDIGDGIEIQVPPWVLCNYDDGGYEPSESEPLFYPPATRQGEAVKSSFLTKGRKKSA